jgi:hypothetical protein
MNPVVSYLKLPRRGRIPFDVFRASSAPVPPFPPHPAPAPDLFGLIAPRTLAQFFSGPYRVPNMRITATALLTNKTPAGTYRAPHRRRMNLLAFVPQLMRGSIIVFKDRYELNCSAIEAQ